MQLLVTKEHGEKAESYGSIYNCIMATAAKDVFDDYLAVGSRDIVVYKDGDAIARYEFDPQIPLDLYGANGGENAVNGSVDLDMLPITVALTKV